MKIVRGAALLVPDNFNNRNSKKHLNVVMNNSASPHGMALLALIASYRYANQDSTCLLHPGDHPFIIRPSYVDYLNPQLIPVDKLLAHIQPKSTAYKQTNRTVPKPIVIPYAHVSEEVLKRIHDGFYTTKRTHDFVFYYLEHPTNRR